MMAATIEEVTISGATRYRVIGIMRRTSPTDYDLEPFMPLFWHRAMAEDIASAINRQDRRWGWVKAGYVPQEVK